MTILLLVLWGLIGTMIGRVLFRQRLKDSARWQFYKSYDHGEQLLSTKDMSSAQTYGLWSIPLWPLTLAVFLIQLPTPEEKAKKAELRAQEALDYLESLNV